MSLPRLRILTAERFGGIEEGNRVLFSNSASNAAPDNFGLPAVARLTDHAMMPGSSSITSIISPRSHLAPKLLAQIVTLPRRLEVLDYASKVSLKRLGPHLSLPRYLSEALRAHSTSLRRLVLDLQYSPDWVMRGGTRWASFLSAPERTFGSLVHLEALRHLDVPFEALWCFQIPEHHAKDDPPSHNPLDALLPRSLTHLILRVSAAWRLAEFLRATGLPHSLSQTRKQLPLLEHFHVVVPPAGVAPESWAFARRSIDEWDSIAKGFDSQLRYSEVLRNPHRFVDI